MKYLATLAALGLCTSVLAQSVMSDGTIVSRDGSTVSPGRITSPDGSTVSRGRITSPDGSVVAPGRITSPDGSTVSSNASSGRAGSVMLDNQSTVTSSVTTDSTGVSSSSIVGANGSMCSASHEGQRCEISCEAPQVATCGRAGSAVGPSCYCR